MTNVATEQARTIAKRIGVAKKAVSRSNNVIVAYKVPTRNEDERRYYRVYAVDNEGRFAVDIGSVVDELTRGDDTDDKPERTMEVTGHGFSVSTSISEDVAWALHIRPERITTILL